MSSTKDDPQRSVRHESVRRPWTEGPAPQAPHGSFLTLDDDELLQRIGVIEAHEDADARLLEVVQSDRHFFVRQEAAKRIRNKKLLFPYEDDRHVGQILVRHLTRREDLTYLERLVARSQFTEVRTAAQVQLARLRKKLTRTPAIDGFPVAALSSETWRVAVLHQDPELRRLVADALPRPEFEVSGYEPGLESTQAIATFDPHLVLSDVQDALANPQLHETIRAQSRYVPLVVLCPADMTAPLVDVLGRGADEFILLPIQPNLLTAKTRALVHFAHRSSSKAERHHLSGAVGPNGVLQLFRLCEEHRLTCRLVVTTQDQRRWVDFLDGEMIEAGGSPPVPDEEALATLLAIRSGTYEIAERRFDEIEEITEAAPAPRRIARLMPDPSAVAMLHEAVPERDAVDASLFGWAVHFIVEQAWMHLGTTVTAGLLRRTQQELVERHPLLRAFQIEDNAHVNVDLSRGARLPHGAVVAVALWMADFLTEARRIVADCEQIKVRQTTVLMADALDQVGFYAAYEVASTHLDRLKV